MEDLARELGRLEGRLSETTPDSRVIDELATVRGGLGRPGDDGARCQLAKVRIASPCKARWADMTGDERVRVCHGCERPVFNLSEMTRDQAERVLATRGIKPCVRFYRRSDGTVMTTDCPTVPRSGHRLTVVAAGTLLSAPALAEPAPAVDPEDVSTHEPDPPPIVDPCADEGPGWTMGVMVEPVVHHAAIEWSTWGRLGYGLGSRAGEVGIAARTTDPLLPEPRTLGEGALGVDASLGVAARGALRLGGWAEVRTVSGPVLGGELIIGVPSRRHGGSVGVVLRGGGNGDVVTGAIGVGYTSAGDWPGHGHASGVRMVTSMTRSVHDARDWSVTLGLELDLLGAIGQILRLGD